MRELEVVNAETIPEAQAVPEEKAAEINLINAIGLDLDRGDGLTVSSSALSLRWLV